MKSIIGLGFLVIVMGLAVVGRHSAQVSQAAKDPPPAPQVPVLAAFEGANANGDTFYGNGAGNTLAATDGHLDTFIGKNAGANTTASGLSNVFVGHSAGISNTSGGFNVFVGQESGFTNSTASRNTFIGFDAGLLNTGTDNTFTGYSAGRATTTATALAFFGVNAGLSNTTGSVNTFIGGNSGRSNTTGTSNTFLGSDSGRNNLLGSGNTFLGDGTGFNNTNGGSNTLVGSGAGSQVNSNNNTFLGASAGTATTAGSNTFIGRAAGFSNSGGAGNVYVGESAGFNATGTGNVFIGRDAGTNESGSAKLYIDDTNTGNPLIYGEFNNDILAINGKLGVGTQSPGARMQVGCGPAPSAACTPQSGPTLLVKEGDSSEIDVTSTSGPAMFFFINSGNGLMGTPTNTPFIIRSNNQNRVWIGADGRIGFNTNTPAHALEVAPTGAFGTPGAFTDGASWSNASSRSLKENFAETDSRSVLEKLVALPVSSWNYKTEGDGVRHLGPTAEDFKATFGLGSTDKAISTVDEGGVALAAIKGLSEENREKDAKIAAQDERLGALEARLAAIESGNPVQPAANAPVSAGKSGPSVASLVALIAAICLSFVSGAALMRSRATAR